MSNIKLNKQGKYNWNMVIILTLIPLIGVFGTGIYIYFNDKNMRILEYHSSLTPKKKFINWNLIQNCKIDIIIGTRSSIFLKIPNLGLIIVDEEHDISLKNNSEAKYNARDIAIYRAKNKNIPVILGTATPSSETILNVIREYHPDKQDKSKDIKMYYLCKEITKFLTGINDLFK